MSKIRNLWNLKYWVLAYAGIAFGLAGMALATTHGSNDRCRAETRETYRWTGMFQLQFEFETGIFCVDDGCSAANGACSGPFQYSAIQHYTDGQGLPQTITRWYCNCVDVTDHGDRFPSSQHCEVIMVEDSGKPTSDPDHLSRECLNLMCAVCVETVEWDPPGPQTPPTEYRRTESCTCQ